MVDVSINVINYNSAKYCKKFKKSVYEMLQNLDSSYEIVLVDKYSDDGSFECLKEMADVIKQEESNRGEARNTCLEIANADVFVDMLDTDEVAFPVLADVIDWYVEEMPDWCLATDAHMINRKDILREIGGWGNYHAGEDRLLWQKLIDTDNYRWLPVKTAEHQKEREESLFRKVKRLASYIPFSLEGMFSDRKVYYDDGGYDYWGETYEIKIDDLDVGDTV